MVYQEGNVLFNDVHVVKDQSDEETRCRHDMGHSFRLAANDLLYAPSQTG